MTKSKKNSQEEKKRPIFFWRFTDKYKEKPLRFDIICFLFFFLITVFLAINTVNRINPLPISYNQKGNINYKVYLNKNNFYSEEYLGMNQAYVASLIKYIDLDFDYLFTIDEKADMDFDYQILADLIIENSSGSSKYFEKQYILKDVYKKKMVSDKLLNIKENIKIDYGYYNQLANSFRSTYGVDTYSYLNVYLNVIAKNGDNSPYHINENRKILIKIPLSEKAIEINLSTNNQDVINHIMSDEVVIFNRIFLILEILFLIPSCYYFVCIMKSIFKLLQVKTAYDRYVRKILRDYDRLIVETSSKLDRKKYHVIEVLTFNELLDAHDNLNLPILFSDLIEHKKGIFYIINNEDVYIYEVDDKKLQ